MPNFASAPLIFSEEIFSDDRYKLFEIPPELLPIIQDTFKGNPDSFESKKLCFKGLSQDEAVLCTEDKTYALKSAQTSNCLLVTRVEKNKDTKNPESFQVLHNLKSVVEVSRTVPRLQRVKELLSPTMYIDPISEHKIQNKTFYTFNDLKELVQASDFELQEVIVKHKIMTLEGRLRLIDLKYFCEVLSLILVSSFVNSFDLSKIDVNKLVDSLKDHPVPPAIISHCLYSVSELKEDGLCCVNEKDVVRVFGESLLKESFNSPISVHRFLDQLREKLPETFNPSLSQLEGLFYLDDYPYIVPYDNKMYYLSAAELPYDPKLRFKEIFSRKSRWAAEEIKPFLEDIVMTDNPKAMDLLILKFCRFINANGKQALICKLKF